MFAPERASRLRAEFPPEWFPLKILRARWVEVYNDSPSAMNICRVPVRWMLIAWMLVISAVSYLDRVNISIAGPSIEREFHLDHIRLGWVFSAWVLGYALFQVGAQILLVVRATAGIAGGAEQHNNSLDMWFAQTPGLLVAAPAFPADSRVSSRPRCAARTRSSSSCTRS